MYSSSISVELDLKRSKLCNRHGAEEARGAHNSEVTGSKPVVGIPNLCIRYWMYVDKFVDMLFKELKVV